MARLLVAMADHDLGELVRFALSRAGHEALPAATAAQAVSSVREEKPDAAIVDIQLPNGDGIALIRRLHADAPLPILALTARDDAQQMAAFDAGADDCLPKPFNMTVLVKRVEALLRRAQPLGGPAAVAAEVAGVRVNFDTNELTTEERGTRRPVYLTRTEARLLRLLLAARGRPVATAVLAARLWGVRDGGGALVKGHIYGLRRKLRAVGAADDVIVTVPGVGYQLARP